MSSKLKKKNSKKTATVKKKVSGGKSLVQSNPKLTMIILVATYFLLDYLMMETAENLHTGWVIAFTMLAPSALYGFYVNDYQQNRYPTGGTDVPKFIKDKKTYTTMGWLIFTLWGVLLLAMEPVLVPNFFPVLDDTYYQAQIMLMIFIAPIMEEIVFRYLLYDRWLKRKWGWFWGFVAASLIFVACHPVGNLHSLVIYWMPTVLFFLIYNEFGLYGSIVIHMIYNMIAI